MRLKATVHEPMYEHNGKQYIRFVLPDEAMKSVEFIHNSKSYLLRSSSFDNPLMGSVLTVKVPFRYRRVMCTVTGLTPVQSLVKGDTVDVIIEFKGVWNVGNYCGFSWKLAFIEHLPQP
jgi:hypothetical protein